MVRGRLLHLHRGAERPRCTVGRRSYTPASEDPSSLALARGSEPVERVRLCEASIFQSHLVMANHADCGPDRWALVLVGQHYNGLERTCHSRARRFDAPGEASLL